MNEYTARVKHSEETFRKTFNLQYKLYKPAAHTYLMVVSFLLVLASFVVPGLSNLVKVILVALACFTVIGLRSPARTMANNAIKALGSKFPVFWYIFHDDEIELTGADRKSLGYKEIIRLIEMEDYLYLFIQNKSAFVIERSSIKPEEAGLKQLLSEKTGLTWEYRKK